MPAIVTFSDSRSWLDVRQEADGGLDRSAAASGPPEAALDPETWGTTPEHIAAQERQMSIR